MEEQLITCAHQGCSKPLTASQRRRGAAYCSRNHKELAARQRRRRARSDIRLAPFRALEAENAAIEAGIERPVLATPPTQPEVPDIDFAADDAAFSRRPESDWRSRMGPGWQEAQA
jgi:hypothetical protein